MLDVDRGELVGLAVFAVALIELMYGVILYFRGLTGFWPSVFLISGGVLGLASAGYLLVIFNAKRIVGG